MQFFQGSRKSKLSCPLSTLKSLKERNWHIWLSKEFSDKEALKERMRDE
jgi:hypothetical protein